MLPPHWYIAVNTPYKNDVPILLTDIKNSYLPRLLVIDKLYFCLTLLTWVLHVCMLSFYIVFNINFKQNEQI